MEKVQRVSFFKRFWNFIEGINGLLLIIYAFFVLVSAAFVHQFDSTAYFLRETIVIGILVCVSAPLVIRTLKKAKISLVSTEAKTIKLSFATFFLLSLLVLLLHYFAYYPGSFALDTVDQYREAITNSYMDWHPVIHTLLVIKLPLLLTGGWIGSIVLFQVMWFSLAIAYASYVVLKLSNKIYAFITLGFFLLNPLTGNTAMFPLKDTSFAIGVLFLVSFSLQIFFTKGEWIKKPLNLIAFIVVISITTLFRHNALLFTIPFFVAILLIISKKRALMIICGILVIIGGIKFPLYSSLQVINPESRQIETLGLPMTVIGAAVKYAPDSLDDEVLDFAYRIAPKEVWEENYVYGSYNTVKNDKRANNQVIEEYGTAQVLKMMLSCIKSSPKHALLGLIKLTDRVYTISDDYSYSRIPDITENEYGIHQEGFGFLRYLNNLYTQGIVLLFPYPFIYIGVAHFLLIAFTLAKCKLNKLNDWKKVLFVLPVFIYNFGSMMLLTGSEDVSRYFFYTMLLVPLYLVLLLRENKANEE